MGKYEIYSISPVLDSTTSGEEQKKITALIGLQRSVALDLSQCTYVSSAGLRVMLYAYKLVKAKQLDICLVGVAPHVREVMQMTGFDNFFHFYATIEEVPQE